MINQKIAKVLYEIADLLEMQNVEFKPYAYRRAAGTIESLDKDLEEIYKKGGTKALEELPGIGKNISEKIKELIETGGLEYYETLKKEFPVDVEALSRIPGIGPKTIKLLYEKLKIKNLDELEKAARTHKIRGIKHLGEKTEENILDNVAIARMKEQRMLLGYALPLAEEIKSELKKLKEVKRIEVAGSLRRRKETIGDIDILVTSNNAEKVMKKFCNLPIVNKVKARGKTKSVILLENNLEVDVRVLKEEEFGSALQYFTGSKEHNIELRKLAIKKRMKLSEYGLFDAKTDKRVAGRTEEEIYNALGMSYIEPELRENKGEINAMLEGKMPKVVNYEDVKGDLHAHTKYSDGSDEVNELLDAAEKMNYKFFGISDHSKSLAIASGLSDKELITHAKRIRKEAEKREMRVFAGVEANILKNGETDVGKKALKELDYAIAAIHSNLNLSKEAQTNRLIKAMENEKVRIIAHPTGRKIYERKAYELDLERVMEAAKERDVALEINGFPIRMDLNDENVRKAIEMDVKLCIGSDAHTKNNLHYLELGTSIAKRSWAEKRHIINCLPVEKLEKFLKR